MNLYKLQRKTIRENGYEYTVNIQMGKADFPTKYYGDITLPAGEYDALKVEIEKQKGKIGGVMLPPCVLWMLVQEWYQTIQTRIKTNLKNEEYNLISKTDDREISFKFKIVELFQSWKLGNR